MLQEELVQPLVAGVDDELLEAVVVAHVLEARDVQEPYAGVAWSEKKTSV